MDKNLREGICCLASGDAVIDWGLIWILCIRKGGRIYGAGESLNMVYLSL